ncbi:MAG: signal recognition particle-docking protein FtsY [Coriobacteriia bacterium]|nr:MAG: signal recognition particle-docking protein FtsY [Coriobacteriia bacterium]
MAFKDKINRSRTKFNERMNVLFRRGPKLDEDFWDDLEETLILSDLGAQATMEVIDRLRDQATRKALPDAYAVLDMLADEISGLFAEPDPDPLRMNPVCVLFVGINGAGKTTTVGKLANQASLGGRKVLIGSGDTFRAAAIEQLDIWGERSGVEVVKRERGSDPASVCYDVVERAEQLGSDLVLIDTSGRLHTSDELMRELQKVVNVTRKRADVDVKTVLVIDATTGQNGLQQAREFDKALDLDGVIMTKLDGTAKGGIAVAVSHELGLPILRVGVGEGIEDLQPFDAREYAEALFGEMRAELEGEVGGGDLSTPVPDGTSGRDDMFVSEEPYHCHFERSEAESRNLATSPSVISSEESEEAPSVISSEESEANGVEKSQPLSSPDDGDLSAPVSDDTSGRDDMLETEKTSMTADEWFAETESETESEPEEQESFRDKMRRWFS